MGWMDIGLALAGLPVLAASAYLAALAMLSRRPAPSASGPPHLTFDVVVPAHDEEAQIATTVDSLHALDYPRTRFRVLVVADNCGDRTAEAAAAAGATVLVRNDAEHRGKGYALNYAFARSLSDRNADAVVVVDADTVVSRNLLTAFAGRFEAGADVVQADYAVGNPMASWRTRMMTIAFAAFHGVRSLARERLGVSCGLRGNGMGFSRAVLLTHPPQAFSIVEDVEYGIQLGYAGVRVHYVDDARVFGQMVATERASRSQRERWENGRRALIRQHAPALLAAAWRRRSGLLLDLALDLLVPPLGDLVAAIAVGAALCAVITALHRGIAPWIWGAAAAGVVLHVLRAWALSEVGATGLVDLLCTPFYVGWKLALRFRSKGPHVKDEWVCTTRRCRLSNTPAGNVDWQRLWVATRQQPWDSLAIIPSEAGIDITRMAESLVTTGRQQGEKPVSVLNATGARLNDVRRLVDELAMMTRRGDWVIVAVDPIADNPSAVPIARAASAALLVVRLGESQLAAARTAIDAIGRSRFLGSLVLDDRDARHGKLMPAAAPAVAALAALGFLQPW